MLILIIVFVTVIDLFKPKLYFNEIAYYGPTQTKIVLKRGVTSPLWVLLTNIVINFLCMQHVLRGNKELLLLPLLFTIWNIV